MIDRLFHLRGIHHGFVANGSEQCLCFLFRIRARRYSLSDFIIHPPGLVSQTCLVHLPQPHPSNWTCTCSCCDRARHLHRLPTATMKVESLLNQDPSRAPLPTSRPAFESQVPSPARTEPEASRNTSIVAASMTRNHNGEARPQSRGEVRFPPYENLNADALATLRRFGVNSVGSIQQSRKRIPYNSGKKEFSHKTGRDCFDVFQYDFRPPGDDAGQRYIIMWDYKIGLVRMTPFFKCCKYPKTMPAKMLSQNPGLKEITHSITGGSIAAQGYWMPFECARAACATFCYEIAGAMTPIFGQDFPSMCLRRDMPGFAKFCIPQGTIERSRREAEHFRWLYSERSAIGRSSAVDRASPGRPPYDVYQNYDAGGPSRQQQQRTRRRDLSINPMQGSDRGVGVLISPGEANRDWYGPPQIGLEPAITTPRSAATQSPPNWAGLNSQAALQNRQYHPYKLGEDFPSGPGALHRDLKEILRDGKTDWYGHHGYPSPASHHPSVSPAPGGHGHGQKPERGGLGYGYGQHYEYTGAEHHRAGSATGWRHHHDAPPEVYGAGPGGPYHDSSGAARYGAARGVHHQASEKDAALVLVSLREPGPGPDTPRREHVRFDGYVLAGDNDNNAYIGAGAAREEAVAVSLRLGLSSSPRQQNNDSDTHRGFGAAAAASSSSSYGQRPILLPPLLSAQGPSDRPVLKRRRATLM
ncbi:hypothetical protein QBC47DRAFT_65452 [Echria macrotheca]|uniref:HTH APSES-type domain-containing protein n=1 Tax=Echria macrotheca TaxID=438768 RepID=A0AAJ0F685_9PEZI|nr:hypothetical protein QBC47DRAFT_65452 [Echria macrotheca]